MKTYTMELAVGLFLAVGIIALFVLAMQVSNLTSFDADRGYMLHASFDNIGGLKVRSPVKASGVRVGRVSAIEFNSQTYQADVILQIDPQFDRFPTDSSASIFTAGLLGEQYIGLEPGAEEEYLQAGDMIDLTESAIVLERLIGQFLYSQALSGTED